MKRLAAMLMAVGVMGLTPALARAQEIGPPAEAADAKPDGLNLRPSKPLETAAASPSLGIGAKLGLAGLVGAAAFFVYRRRTQGAGKVSKVADLRVTARTSVGHRSEVIVVEVDGQRLLLGVTPGSIRTLTVLADDVAADTEVDSEAPTAAEEGLARLFASARRELEPEIIDEPRPSRISPSAARSNHPLITGRTAVLPTTKGRQASHTSDRPTLVSNPTQAVSSSKRVTRKSGTASSTSSSIEGQAAGLMSIRSGR